MKVLGPYMILTIHTHFIYKNACLCMCKELTILDFHPGKLCECVFMFFLAKILFTLKNLVRI